VARHTLVYAIGMIIGRAVSFLMLPIYTRFLTPADYGVMALVEMTLDFISIVAGARLALGLFRYYHKAETPDDRNDVVSTSFLLIAIMYTLVGGVAFLAAAPLSALVFGSGEHTILFRVAAVNVALGALSIIPFSLARVQDRSLLFVGMSLCKLALQITFVLLFLVVMGLGVLGVFLATLVANFTVGAVMTVWLFRRVRLSWTGGAARDLLRYGVPLMATQVATFATTFSDRFFLQAVADEAVVGLYNLAYQFGFIMVMLGYGPIEQIWGPKRFAVAKESNSDDILARGFLLINVVLISVAVAIALFVKDLLRVMATPEFHPAYQVVPLILTAYIFSSWSSIQDIGVLIREKTKYIAIANFVVAAVAICGFFIFVPRFLQWGAAGVTVVAFALQFALVYWFSQRLWRVRYRWRPVLILVAWAATIILVGILLPEMKIVSSVLLRSGLGLIFLGGIWFLPILGAEDKQVGVTLATSLLTRVRAPRPAARGDS
jgi:O-antigen/teichoic acid export membrane protein